MHVTTSIESTIFRRQSCCRLIARGATLPIPALASLALAILLAAANVASSQSIATALDLSCENMLELSVDLEASSPGDFLAPSLFDVTAEVDRSNLAALSSLNVSNESDVLRAMLRALQSSVLIEAIDASPEPEIAIRCPLDPIDRMDLRGLCEDAPQSPPSACLQCECSCAPRMALVGLEFQSRPNTVWSAVTDSYVSDSKLLWQDAQRRTTHDTSRAGQR